MARTAEAARPGARMDPGRRETACVLRTVRRARRYRLRCRRECRQPNQGVPPPRRARRRGGTPDVVRLAAGRGVRARAGVHPDPAGARRRGWHGRTAVVRGDDDRFDVAGVGQSRAEQRPIRRLPLGARGTGSGDHARCADRAPRRTRVYQDRRRGIRTRGAEGSLAPSSGPLVRVHPGVRGRSAGMHGAPRIPRFLPVQLLPGRHAAP